MLLKDVTDVYFAKARRTSDKLDSSKGWGAELLFSSIVIGAS